MEVAEPIDNGRYRLIELLGEGGMAAVYRAWDTRLSAWRAVKVLSPRAAASASIRSRFLDEARVLARLQHRNLLVVHDVGFDGDRPFIVMELVPGGSLMDVVEKEGPLHPAFACKLMAAVLDALQVAHDNDVVHRDIKPHNIMLAADGTPLVADFGIARLGGDLETNRTRTGATMGTLAYMAPEQRTHARKVDGRADIYAAGNTLFTLLTGREPFDLFALADDDPQLAGIPSSLLEILRRATQHDPADRYPTASAMAQALREVEPELADLEGGVVDLPAPTQWDSSPPASTTASTFALDEEAPPTPPAKNHRFPVWGYLLAGLFLAGSFAGATLCAGIVALTALPGGDDAPPPPDGPAPVTKQPVAPSPAVDPIDLGPSSVEGPPRPWTEIGDDPLDPTELASWLERMLDERVPALEACAAEQDLAAVVDLQARFGLGETSNTLDLTTSVPAAELASCAREILVGIPGPKLEGPPRSVTVTMRFGGGSVERGPVTYDPRRRLELSPPPWEARTVEPVEGNFMEVRFRRRSSKKLRVLQRPEAWLRQQGFSVAAWVASAPDIGVERPEPVRVTGFEPETIILEGDSHVAIQGVELVVFDGRGLPEVALDFSSYRFGHAIRVASVPPASIEQRPRWAVLLDGILYVSTAHQSRSSASFGRNGYLTAIDVEDGSLRWRSEPLVCNTHNFVVMGDTIVCGYGEQDGPNVLVEIERRTGQTRRRFELKGHPSWVVRQGEQIHVHTSLRDYVFAPERPRP